MNKDLIFSICTALKWLSGVIFGIILDSFFTIKFTSIKLIILELGLIFIFLFLATGQWLKHIYYKSEFKRLEINLQSLNENRKGLISDRERLLRKIETLEAQNNYQQILSVLINELIPQTTNQIGDKNDIQKNSKNYKDN